jgi:hypothetical protein
MSEVILPDDDRIILNWVDCDTPAQVNRSKWTGGRTVIGLPGAELWKASVTLDTIETEFDERPWRAFFRKMRGVQNWFRLVVAEQLPSGARPIVASGALAGLYTVPLKGMTPNARVLFAGQYMTLVMPSGAYRLVCLEENLQADNSGNATAQFSPALREAPAVDSFVECDQPFMPASLTETSVKIILDNAVSSASFEVEEA